MTVVYEDLDLPGGSAPLAEVSIELAGNECRPIVGYHSVSHAVIGTLTLKSGQGIAANGYWTADLVPNSQIVPANTVYRVTRRAYDGVVDVVCVTVPVVTGAGGVALGSLTPESPTGVDPTALAVHTSDLFAHGDAHDVSWWSTSDWDRFTIVPATNPGDSTHTLTADQGTGVITGAPGGNDRILYLLEGTEALTDVEARVDIELGGTSAQGGLALSADTDTAILLWTNILISNAVLIPGIWEYDGALSLNTNQQSPTLDGFKSSVASASGDGTTVTVYTVLPHDVTPGQIVHFDASFGGFNQFTVVAVPNDTTFTFSSSTTGSWTGGTFRVLFLPSRFKLAARRVGNQLSYKHWLPTHDEPEWDDPLKAATITLPTSLAGGGTLPTRGSVGLLGAHLNGTVRFSNLVIRDLTRSDTPPALDDAQAKDELGTLTARVNAYLPHTIPGPQDQNMVSWSFDAVNAAGGTALTNGDMWLVKLMIRESATVDTVYFAVTTSDSDPVAGQNQLALYSPAGTRMHAAASLDSVVTSTGLKTITIPATLVVPPFVWVAVVVNFTTGGTFSLLRGTTSVFGGSLNAGLGVSQYRFGRAATGQTSLPASFTPASITGPSASNWWFGLAT